MSRFRGFSGTIFMASFMASLCAGLTLATAGDASAQEAPRNIADCADVEDSKLRLACYDSFARAMKPTSEPAPAAAAPAAATLASSATAPMPTASETFGNPPKTKKERDLEIKSIDVVITKARKQRYGGWSMLTEDGQIWRQTDSYKLRLRNFPLRATIRKGKLGSYFMAIDGVKRSVRVARQK